MSCYKSRWFYWKYWKNPRLKSEFPLGYVSGSSSVSAEPKSVGDRATTHTLARLSKCLPLWFYFFVIYFYQRGLEISLSNNDFPSRRAAIKQLLPHYQFVSRNMNMAKIYPGDATYLICFWQGFGFWLSAKSRYRYEWQWR